MDTGGDIVRYLFVPDHVNKTRNRVIYIFTPPKKDNNNNEKKKRPVMAKKLAHMFNSKWEKFKFKFKKNLCVGPFQCNHIAGLILDK